MKNIMSRIVGQLLLRKTEFRDFVPLRLVEIVVQLVLVGMLLLVQLLFNNILSFAVAVQLSFVRLLPLVQLDFDAVFSFVVSLQLNFVELANLDFEDIFLFVIAVDCFVIGYYICKYKLIGRKTISLINIIFLLLPLLINLLSIIFILQLFILELNFVKRVLLLLIIISLLYLSAVWTRNFLKDKVELKWTTQLWVLVGIFLAFWIPTYLSFNLKDEGVAALTWFIPLIVPLVFDVGIFSNNYTIVGERYIPTVKFHYIKAMFTIILSCYVFILQVLWKPLEQKMEFLKMLPYIKEYDGTWWSYVVYISLVSLVIASGIAIFLVMFFQSIVSNKNSGLLIVKPEHRQLKYKRLKK